MRIAIVGLGTAGAAAAALCARRGLSVIGLERGALEAAGARWMNGVPGWAFDEAGIERPQPPECGGGGGRFHLTVGWGPERVSIQDAGVLEVDMRALTARLQRLAREAGAELRGGVKVLGLKGRALETDQGLIEADCFVDASGLKGVRLLGQPKAPAEDLCVAAQQVHEVADSQGAAAFLRENRAEEGEVVCFTGVAGGYSIVNIRVEGGHVALLTGSIPALGHPSGVALLEQALEAHPWIGAKRFGGARAIPLGLPLACVGQGRVALIGDAARQVYAAHGSGIGQQLVAARCLADALAAGVGPEGYNLRWQRRWGGLVASADVFRRFSQSLSVEELGGLVAGGVLSSGMMLDGLRQTPLKPPLGALLRAGRGLLGQAALLPRLVPVLARLPLVQAHYARYPEDPSQRAAWTARLHRLAGVRGSV